MTGSMLCKQLLALVMNSRPVPEKLATVIMEELMNKMDKVTASDIFYLSIALGKG